MTALRDVVLHHRACSVADDAALYLCDRPALPVRASPGPALSASTAGTSTGLSTATTLARTANKLGHLGISGLKRVVASTSGALDWGEGSMAWVVLGEGEGPAA